MKEPPDRLDELLDQWQTGQHDQQIRVGSRLPSLPPNAGTASGPLRAVPPSGPGEGDLRELVETARRVQALPLKPSAEFAARSEQGFLAQAERLRTQQRRDRLALVPGQQPKHTTFLTPSWMRVHPAWAAVVLLFATLGVLSLLGVVGAQADSPSNPFYQVKLLEQDVQLSLASPADRVRLNLQYAQDDLTALQQHTAPQDAANYSQLLARLDDAFTQAASNLSAVPAGDEHDQLARQLDDLKATAQTTLRGMLGQLTLEQRVATTTELGKLGATVPVIASVTVTPGEGHKVTVLITGSGFQPGATLLLDGLPSSASVTVSSTTVEVVLEFPTDARLASFGVANPDGTVAETHQATWNQAQPTPSPTAKPTHEPDPGATATPTPTAGGEHGTPTPGPGH